MTILKVYKVYKRNPLTVKNKQKKMPVPLISIQRIKITKPADLLEVMHDSVTRYNICLTEEDTCSQDIDDEIEYIQILSKQISHTMPQISFAKHFWRNIMNFVDNNDIIQRLVAIATNNKMTPRETRGLFFKGVIEACQTIQTVPLPKRNIVLRLLMPNTEEVMVMVLGERIAAIRYSMRVRRIVVDNIVQ